MVKQVYTARDATLGPHLPVVFEGSSITLQLPPNDETLGGWKLLSLFPPVVGKLLLYTVDQNLVLTLLYSDHYRGCGQL